MGCFQCKLKLISHDPVLPDQIHPIKQSGLNFMISSSDLCKEKLGLIQDDYILFNPPIGKGTYGEVRQALQKSTNLHRAIKIIPTNIFSPEKKRKLMTEIEILKKLVY